MQLILSFGHLLGVCLAVGTMLAVDLRLLATIAGYRVVIPPPTRFETRIVSVALALLYVTGVGLIVLGLAARPDYLANEKLQAKLMLVALLTLNAVALHRLVFPVLERAAPVSGWPRGARLRVAAFVGLSNSLWMYCAFLGIARPWNHTVSLEHVLGIGLALWAAMALAMFLMLGLARRDEPRGDWVDFVKTTLSGLSDMGAYDVERVPMRELEARPPRPAGAPRSD